MKDMTHSMNADHGGEGAVKGFTDPGSPSTRRQQKMKQLENANLADTLSCELVNEAAEMEYGGQMSGGFLPRRNRTDRF